MAWKTFFIFCAVIYVSLAKNEEYEGHTLYAVKPKNVIETGLVNDIENYLDLDVWSHALPEVAGHVLVPATKKQQFESELYYNGIDFTIESNNIKQQLDLEEQMLAAAAQKRNRSSPHLDFENIHRHDAVNEYLEFLASAYDHVTVELAGKSFEGRDIKYVKISTTNFQDKSKPIVMMESLLHAREWVTLPATLYAIRKLVVDVSEHDLLQNIDWIIIPVANPDGYEHTHTSSRFWRKNRATGYMIGNACMGVDLNRNWDFAWSTGSSGQACSDTFHGRGPESEPEVAAIAKIIREHKDRIKLFLDIHSFGSYILYGFGTGLLPSNALTIHLGGINMAHAIDNVKIPSNRDYLVGNSALTLYSNSGSAQDYAQYIGIPLAYTYELPGFRNTNTVLGFMVDPAFIEQAGYETWEGIKTGARFALNKYGK